MSGTNGQPDYCPVEPRLAHCYRALGGGSEFLVGNCWCTLPLSAEGTAYGGPMPEGDYAGSAFCAASLPRAILGHVQVLPREKAVVRGGDKTGHADLDARYRTLAPLGSGSRSVIARAAARAGLPPQADLIGA